MTSPTEPTHPAGFTLLEMLTVIAILGLMLGLLTSRGADHNKTMSLKSAADALAEGLRIARTDAIVEGHPAILTIQSTPPAWSGPDGAVTPLPPEMAISVSTDHAFSATPSSDPIRFEPDGSSNGGEITLAQGAQRLSIDVDWLTGGVSIAPPPPASP